MYTFVQVLGSRVLVLSEVIEWSAVKSSILSHRLTLLFLSFHSTS
jgi:hypothetical protein